MKLYMYGQAKTPRTNWRKISHIERRRTERRRSQFETKLSRRTASRRRIQHPIKPILSPSRYEQRGDEEPTMQIPTQKTQVTGHRRQSRRQKPWDPSTTVTRWGADTRLGFRLGFKSAMSMGVWESGSEFIDSKPTQRVSGWSDPTTLSLYV